MTLYDYNFTVDTENIKIIITKIAKPSEHAWITSERKCKPNSSYIRLLTLYALCFTVYLTFQLDRNVLCPNFLPVPII